MKRLSIAVLLIAVSLSAGAEPSARELILTIEGMDCGGCATGIEAMLETLDGVIRASVSFEQKEGRISYDAVKLTPEKIIAEIEDHGYKVTVKK